MTSWVAWMDFRRVSKKSLSLRAQCTVYMGRCKSEEERGGECTWLSSNPARSRDTAYEPF